MEILEGERKRKRREREWKKKRDLSLAQCLVLHKAHKRVVLNAKHEPYGRGFS